MNTQVAYTTQTAKTVPQTLEALIETLKQRSFSILSTINVSKIIKEKTGTDIDDYLILDVCNAKDASRALSLHKEVGLVLPCKIIIYKDNEKTKISMYRPTESIKVLGFSDLKELAQDVEHHLKEAIDSAAIV
jgi:uncharacterized protein (DUF302 family)